MSKVIFLDIDGVLNSQQSCHYYYRLWKDGQRDKKGRGTDEFCPIALSNLNHVCEVLNAKGVTFSIVISSTWRLGRSVEELQRVFADNGFRFSCHIVGKTPNHDDGYRGREIQAWLEAHPAVEEFVIIDDDSDMEPLTRYFVQTDDAVGFSWHNATEVIRRLAPEGT